MNENKSTSDPAEPIELVLITGSVREGRFGPVVTDWVSSQADAHGGFATHVIDLAEIDLPMQLPGVPPKLAGVDYPRPASMRRATDLLDAGDAFLVVTPEYNHSYPASLKALIDWHFTQWAAKPVAFVSYGGAAGGRHAVLHLENVMSELHAVTIHDGLAFPNYYLTWEDGLPSDDGSDRRAQTLLNQLGWWGRWLRTARRSEAYPGGA